jgi:hypothetical protein
MALWFPQTSRRSKETGKFRTRPRPGTQKTSGTEYRDWSYHFISHRTGTSVRRTTYSVAIVDPYQNRVAYLRDFPNIEKAATAAREWIDHKLSLIWPKTLADLGKIPDVPAPEMPAQEK